MQRRLEFYGLLTLIVLSPLPFGANRPWAWALLSAWVGLLALLKAVNDFALSKPEDLGDIRRRAWPFTILLLAVVLIVLQVVPSTLRSLSHPIWSEISAQLGENLPTYISVSPELTWDALMVFAALALTFWIADANARDAKNARTIILALIAAANVYSIYGLVSYLGNLNLILWYEKTSYVGSLTGVFVNRNHFATYIGMALISSVVLFWEQFVSHGQYGRSRQFSDHELATKSMLFLSVVILSTALLLTQSRAGVFSCFLAIIVALGLVLYVRKSRAKTLLGAGFLFAGGMIFTLFISGDGLESRFSSFEQDQGMRMTLYSKVTESIIDSLWTGSGAGAFEPSFRIYKDQVLGAYNWDAAHNVYLQVLSDIGLIGFVIVLLMFSFILYELIKGLSRRRRDHCFCIFGIGVFVLIMTHSLVDFSIQIPANGVAFSSIIAVAFRQSVSSRRLSSESSVR